MGNRNPKPISVLNPDSVDGVFTQKRVSFVQVNSSLSKGLSERSFASISSHNSNYSFYRPWSRISHKRGKTSQISKSSKAVWPVSQIEATFLPEFPVTALKNKHNFELLQIVNNGSFGRVYKVYNRQDDKNYALKVLSKFKIIKEDLVQQVKDEVKIQEICGHHPFIVKGSVRWQNKNRLFIISEFVEGGELYELLKRYHILPKQLIQIYVAQLAFVLDFLHNAGIIYRDLKPENILLDENANLQVIDFGLSKWLPYGEKTNTICGTQQYMAPEIITSEGYGHAVDWWSLGILTCLMLTFEYPTLSNKDFKTLILPTDEPLDSGSKDILLRLLEVDPTKRLRSLRSLQNIAFFQHFNFENVRQRRVNPKEILESSFANRTPGENGEILKMRHFSE